MMELTRGGDYVTRRIWKSFGRRGRADGGRISCPVCDQPDLDLPGCGEAREDRMFVAADRVFYVAIWVAGLLCAAG